MQTIKTSELTGIALDWAVAKCCGEVTELESDGITWSFKLNGKLKVLAKGWRMSWRPSEDWAQGGPIIERENLCVGRKHQADTNYCEVNDPAVDWWARTTAGGCLSYGPTPLIAAMRCFVANKQGDVVEVPDELQELTKEY